MNLFLVCLVAGIAVASAATTEKSVTASYYLPCPPDFHGRPPNCTANPYLPAKVDVCPAGQVGVPPNCYVPCPSYQARRADGTCHAIPCPANSEGDFQPHCTFRQCPHGQFGIFPNCYNATIPTEYCKNGLIGSWPDCYEPCPAYHYGRKPDCKPVPCPKGEGWVGSFQPDCKFTPSCPADRPGVWPNCLGWYCPNDSIGTWPDCKCRPPATGTPGQCDGSSKPPTDLKPPGPKTPTPKTPKPPGPTPGPRPPPPKVTRAPEGYLPPVTYLPAKKN